MIDKRIVDVLKLSGLYETKKQREQCNSMLESIQDYFYFVPKQLTDGGDPEYFTKSEYGQLFLNLKENEQDLYLSMHKSEIEELANCGIELIGVEHLLLDEILFIYIKLIRYNNPETLIEFDAQEGAFSGHLLFMKCLELYETMKKNKGMESRAERRRKVVKKETKKDDKEYVYTVDGIEMSQADYDAWYNALLPDERAGALSRVSAKEKI